ncbi:MAG: radical SAM protein [Actinomycetota bacterium]|nr:radical SAM protein [Actinomycetota bacterium]
MNILLVSTYELGTRPLGCTVPAALLAEAGHQTEAVDLSLEALRDDDVSWADGVALSVPMHTALRLGLRVLERVRAVAPRVPLFVHGLYAEAAADAFAGRLGPGDVCAAGEVGSALLAWAAALKRPVPPPFARRRALGSPKPAHRPAQARAGLPGLERYAGLQIGDEVRLVGTIETTSGCNHRCRHCPVPVVYGGRSRPVALESILADADAMVAEGATHLHLADPDFVNRPAHARSVLETLSRRHRGLSFDATVKVSHILRHRELFAELAAFGLVLVTTAVESTSDVVLAHLDKGHTRADAVAALGWLRSLSIEVRPSLLPFTPWSTAADLLDLLDFVAEEDLVESVDAVQYGIRLLLPPGSLLAADPDPVLAASLVGEDPAIPGTAWRHLDPAIDALQVTVAALAEQLDQAGAGAREGYEAIRAAYFAGLRRPASPAPAPRSVATAPRPRLTESWFCCAEPTTAQLSALGAGSAADAGGGAAC